MSLVYVQRDNNMTGLWTANCVIESLVSDSLMQLIMIVITVENLLANVAPSNITKIISVIINGAVLLCKFF